MLDLWSSPGGEGQVEATATASPRPAMQMETVSLSTTLPLHAIWFDLVSCGGGQCWRFPLGLIHNGNRQKHVWISGDLLGCFSVLSTHLSEYNDQRLRPLWAPLE